ncbi:uncharacterized protein LOC124366095 [Homalodisca vitripennis]|uniref:uncharacterized protein LOC124366095 n=1 Tax=Homalodisca vitripennis TaxID=197043 RepID=UPI001EE9B4A8|nr:uncharacterized protein LOC124366095 [Homalodisca vitripennis]
MYIKLLQLILASCLALDGFCAVFTMVPCEPGELVFIDCNLCTCNRQGFPNQVCARMWCPPPPKSQQNQTTTTTTVSPVPGPGPETDTGAHAQTENHPDFPDEQDNAVFNTI